MNLRQLVGRSSLGLLTLAVLLIAPNTASAFEVMCANNFGNCTISNDGQSFITCSCFDNSSTEGSGGDEFAGLSEAELLVICQEHLAWCEQQQGDGDGDGSTGTTVGTSTSGDGDGDGDGDGGSTTFTTSSSTGDGDGDGDSSTTAMSTSTGSDGSTSSGTGDGDGDGDGDSTTNADDGTTTNSSSTDSQNGSSETSAAGDEVGADQGCACDLTPHGSGLGLLALSMLGLIGLRRREQA